MGNTHPDPLPMLRPCNLTYCSQILSCALVATVFADVSHIYRPHQYTYQPVQHYNPVPVPVQTYHTQQQIPILRQDQDVREDGSYSYNYETGNGIAAQEQASVRAVGQDLAKSAQGSYSYTSPEGELVQISYVADENGYQAAGSHIPTPPPVPAAIQRALDWIAAHPQPASQTYNNYNQYQQRRFF
ncbi:endocuticle structural glycoprotein SgAbd-2-like [Aethina tumida]|uniref:endocuticle structural glycoprotein SgAbd-2-like n=1 Tax=Aethina tumida TaxID=116153 RepID=UPI0021479C6D|nr:endocuticle structural glycoprotein SgAbd-2-like [Aethina tumida]